MSAASPVFICGMARSGTTLLQRLLDGHPELASLPGETYFYKAVIEKKVWGPLYRAAEYSGCNSLLSSIGRRYWQSIIAVDTQAFRNALERWTRQFAAGAADAGRDRIDALCRSAPAPEEYWGCYLAILEAHTQRSLSSCQAWVEKTPSNERFVPLIHAQFRGSERYVHIIRDPRDVVASWLLRTLPSAAERARLILRVCQSWAMSVNLARYHRNRHADRYRILRFEALVSDTEALMQETANWLGIAMQPALLCATEGGEAASDNSAHPASLAPGEVSPVPVGRHGEVLQAEELRMIEHLLGRQMQGCGYACDAGAASASGETPLPEYSPGALPDRLRRLHIRRLQRRPLRLR